MKDGDTFRRRKIATGKYQCGCYWRRDPQYGDVLVECPIHHAAGLISIQRFERECPEYATKERR